MKDVFSEIDRRVENLKLSEFCTWLSQSDPTEDRFGFIPSQSFLVFGFRDLLLSLKVKNPQTEFEHLINEHCQEDGDHWKWYLNDLKRLGFDLGSWGLSFTDLIEGMWSEDQIDVRQLIYTSMHYIKGTNNPAVSLVIIEILEGAFEAFIESMRVPVNRFGLYKKLQYYGKTHTEKEEAHTLWDGPENILLQTDLTVDEKVYCLEATEVIFDLFDATFAVWYNKRNDYKRQVEQPEFQLETVEFQEALGN